MLGGIDLFTLNLLAGLAPYLIITISLNLEYGYAGVPNFGKVLAVAGGAFMAGIIPGRLLASLMGLNLDYINDNSKLVSIINGSLVMNPTLSVEILILTLVAAALFGAFLGLLVAYPVKRLRADFLGMTFLAAGQVILVIGNDYSPLAGGTFGVAVPDVFAFVSQNPLLGLLPGEMRNVFAILFMSVIALLVFFYARRLTHSPLGRVLRAIRDDENSALALGKNVQRNRITIIIISSAIAALAGALFSLYTADVFTATYNRTVWTFWPWVMVILGGAGNDIGVVLGTFVFVAVRQTIQYYQDAFASILPFNVAWLDTLLLGLALLFILIYRPDGLIREKPIKTIKKESSPANGELKESSTQQTATMNERPNRTIGVLFNFKRKNKTES